METMNERPEASRRGMMMLQIGAIVLAYFGLFGVLVYAVLQVAQNGI